MGALIFGLTIFFLGLQTAYLCYYAAWAAFGAKPKAPEANRPPQTRFAVLLPAYREDGVIVGSAAEALKQDYPAGLFQVIVIADQLQPDTLVQLRKMPVEIVEVAFERSTKARALQATLARYEEDAFDAALVLDADNHMAPEVLRRMDAAFQQGHEVLQGRRIAKNTHTAYAQLDTLSEAINNRLFRRGVQAAGGSPALIGSGMAFRFSSFKSLMADIDAVSGFDKQLELAMLARGIRAHYLEDARILDEKVSGGDHFTRQRGRWLAAQWLYGPALLIPALRLWRKTGNRLYLAKVIQHVLLPRPVLMAMLLLLLVPAFFLGAWAFAISLIHLLFFGLSMLLALPPVLRNRRLMGSLLHLPLATLRMLLALKWLRKATREFIHTPHSAHA